MLRRGGRRRAAIPLRGAAHRLRRTRRRETRRVDSRLAREQPGAVVSPWPSVPQLQRLEKRNQRGLVRRRQIEPEVVAFYGTRRHTIPFEPGGDVIIAEAPRIEPVFEGGDR